MTQHGLWVSYSGTGRLALAAVLLAAAAALVYAGLRLPLPADPPRPGRKAAVFMLAAWVLAIAAFLACLVVYIQQARRDGLVHEGRSAASADSPGLCDADKGQRDIPAGSAWTLTPVPRPGQAPLC